MTDRRTKTWSALLALLMTVGCSTGADHQADDEAPAPAAEAPAQEPAAQEPAAQEPAAQEPKTVGEATGEGHDRGQHGAGDDAAQPHGHRFTEPEKYVQRWNAPERDAWQKPDEVIRVLGLEEGMSVADLGTGTGYFVPHLAEAVGPEGAVVALDIEQAMVDFVAAKATEEGLAVVEARKVAVDDPGLPPGSVDRIVTVNTWHHIPGREAYAKKLVAALTPGGKLAVVDFTKEADQGPPAQMRLAPEAVVAELEAAGFEAEVAQESLPRQYIVVGTKAE